MIIPDEDHVFSCITVHPSVNEEIKPWIRWIKAYNDEDHIVSNSWQELIAPKLRTLHKEQKR
jgi:hypothetical protein